MTVMMTMTHRFGFQGLELKLGRFTLTAAGPHAWPLAHSLRWLLFAAFTARIVHASAKRARK